MENQTQENQDGTKTVASSETQTPKKKSKTILERLKGTNSTIRKIAKITKSAIKIGLVIVTLGGAYWFYKQLNRPDEQVKEDGRRIRTEEIPQQYPVTSKAPGNDIRRESADFGSRVGEWMLTGEYPSKPAEQVHQEAEEIREQIGKKETGVRKKSADLGSRVGEWLKGGGR